MIAIGRTIGTNPGSFKEEKEWDFSTTDSSEREGAADDDNCEESSNLILTGDEEDEENNEEEGEFSGRSAAEVNNLGFPVFTNDMIEKQIRHP